MAKSDLSDVPTKYPKVLLIQTDLQTFCEYTSLDWLLRLSICIVKW